eukprot:TRINITY_DN2337_c1_g1_i1.p1 TRINITY_DN2337_c1_g1~~TRINITY_DN2337_c1_g1_i1.p1  ORF type:complete len:592 (+),score=169.67 TRINITY_DN2337_c1_g1_i1:139-1776(+)
MAHMHTEWSLEADSEGSDTPRSKASARKSCSPTPGDHPPAAWLGGLPPAPGKASPVFGAYERTRRGGGGYAVNLSVGTFLRMLGDLPTPQLQRLMTVSLNDANKVKVADVLALVQDVLADEEMAVPVYGINQLPSEILELTLSYLPPSSLLVCERVSRGWRGLCSRSARIASVWRRLCYGAWPSFAAEQEAAPVPRLPCPSPPAVPAPDALPPPAIPAAGGDPLAWKQMYSSKARAEQTWLNPTKHPDRPLIAETVLTQDNGIHCIQFDGSDLMTGSGERHEIGVWTMARNQQRPRHGLDGHKNAVTCLQFDEERVVSGSLDNTVRIWDRATGECERTLTGHRDKVWCVQFEGSRLVSGSSDKMVRVWDMNTGESICSLEEHRTSVSCVRIQGDTVVSSSAGNSIRVWNIAQTPTCTQKLRGHQKGVFCLQFDQSKILSGSLDSTIRVWDPRDSYRNVCTILATEGTDAAHDSTRPTGIICFAYDDTKIIAGGADGKVDIWDMRTWRHVTNFAAHTHWITSLQFDSERLVTGSRDRSVRMWSVPP